MARHGDRWEEEPERSEVEWQRKKERIALPGCAMRVTERPMTNEHHAV